MFANRPCALIVDRDAAGRARMTGLLRENGFIAAAFRDGGGALAALAARAVDVIVLAGEVSEGEDALALARQMRRCRPGSRVLFAGAAPTLVGVTQVNVRIPTTVLGTGPVPLTVQVGRYTPNQLAITIAVK